MNRFFKRIAISLWWLVAVCVISAALLLGMARLLLPSLGNYRSDVEAWLSEYLQHSVSVDSLDLRWRGLGLQLTLKGFQIAEPVADTALLGVREAFVDTDLWNLLLQREGVVRGIDLVGLALQLDVRHDGSIVTQGVELWRPGAKSSGGLPGDVLTVLAAPRRITLSDVTLRVHDRRRNITHLLDDISVHLQHVGTHHSLHAEVPLPYALGERLSVDLDFVGDPADPRAWVGRLYAALSGVQLHNWTAFVPDLPLQLASGAVDGELWMDWAEASLHSAHARAEIRDLTVLTHRADAGVQRWRAAEVSGDWNWRRTADGWTAQIDRFRLREENGVLRPQTGGRFEYREGNQAGGLRGRWGYVNLADIAGWLPLAQAVGFESDVVRRITAMQVRGEIHDLDFRLPLVASGSRALRMRFEQLRSKPDGKLPGFSGMSGALQFTASGGRMKVLSESFTLDYPQMFRDPIQVQQLAGDFGFDFTDGLRLWAPRLEVANSHLRSVGRLDVHWQADKPLFLDLQVDFREGDGRFASRYVPVGLMPRKLTDWLDASIVEGRVASGSALFYGPARRFPFREGDGVFQVDFEVRDAALKYQPDWPAIERVAAHVRFAQAGLEVNAHSGHIHGTELQRGSARFVDLQTGVMEVRGSITGDVAQNLSFIRMSPLRRYLGALFDDARGSGDSVVSVDLTLPIRDLAAFEVSGTVALANASLVADAWQLDLDRLRGDVAFTRNSFSIEDMQGRLYKRLVKLRARPRERGAGTRIYADGEFSAGELLGNILPELSASLDGRAQWQLQVDLPARQGGEVAVRARSSLRGIAVNLPAPLRKPREGAEDFDLRLLFQQSGNRVRVVSRYAKLLSADLGLSRDGSGGLVIKRGVVKSGEQHAVLGQQQGLHVNIEAAEVDLDGWWAFAQSASGEAFVLNALQRFNLRAQRALFNERSAGPLTVTVYRNPTSWAVGVENPSLSGSLDWPVERQSRQPARVNLQKLDLVLFDDAEDSQDRVAPVPLRPHELPPLRIVIDELHWRNTRLDNVRFVATPRDRNLVFDELSFDNGALRLWGTGDWRETDNGLLHSRVEFRMESKDWGKGLERLGYAQTMRDGDGYISADLSWPGPLYRPVLENLQGTLRMRITSGSLIGADPGLGRIVGLFSLQALPRRLALDFEDVLIEGFDFDRIHGTLELSDGVAFTREMQMRGTVGRVDITGRSDLAEQVYEQEVVVTPNLSASLPLAGELVVPGSGITLLLVGALLKGLGVDLGKLGELQYTLTGPWDDPVFTKVVTPTRESLTGDR
ncbi:MAG: YhdP family protein [Gammaproteobacteria bacterium]|nr:YhdP family protein [Gammaproteobacteria bacterium]